MPNRFVLLTVACVVLSQSVSSQSPVNPADTNINSVNSPNVEPSATVDIDATATDIVVDKQQSDEQSQHGDSNAQCRSDGLGIFLSEELLAKI